MGLKLSGLDLSPTESGRSAQSALRDSLRLVCQLDGLGYKRYWFGEHHAVSDLAGCTPEVLVASAAALTSRIRVGAGGLAMVNYGPLKVAEIAGSLNSLFPNRIDIAIGTGSGAPSSVMEQLGAGASASADRREVFRTKLQEIRELQSFAPAGSVLSPPDELVEPAVWILTGSGASAMVAAEFGTGLVVGHFIKGKPADPAIIKRYVQEFRPSAWATRPAVAVAVSVVLDTRRPRATTSNTVYAPSGAIRARLRDIADRYCSDDVILSIGGGSYSWRLRTYDLLAREILGTGDKYSVERTPDSFSQDAEMVPEL